MYVFCQNYNCIINSSLYVKIVILGQKDMPYNLKVNPIVQENNSTN